MSMTTARRCGCYSTTSEASHELNAIMCHGGDLLNNWPMAGKLAKQWAKQECTLPAAILRAQHYINMMGRMSGWMATTKR
jgi:hypothetical protein